MRWAGNVACIGDGRGAYWVLLGMSEGKRRLERTSPRWEDDIKADLLRSEMRREGLD